jgi:hypothetical protein
MELKLCSVRNQIANGRTDARLYNINNENDFNFNQCHKTLFMTILINSSYLKFCREKEVGTLTNNYKIFKSADGLTLFTCLG